MSSRLSQQAIFYRLAKLNSWATDLLDEMANNAARNEQASMARNIQALGANRAEGTSLTILFLLLRKASR